MSVIAVRHRHDFFFFSRKRECIGKGEHEEENRDQQLWEFYEFIRRHHFIVVVVVVVVVCNKTEMGILKELLLLLVFQSDDDDSITSKSPRLRLYRQYINTINNNTKIFNAKS